jgi:hypothetical protein
MSGGHVTEIKKHKLVSLCLNQFRVKTSGQIVVKHGQICGENCGEKKKKVAKKKIIWRVMAKKKNGQGNPWWSTFTIGNMYYICSLFIFNHQATPIIFLVLRARFVNIAERRE